MDEEEVNSSAVGSPPGVNRLVKSSRAGGPVTCVALATLPSTSSRSSFPTFALAAQGPYMTRYGLSPRDQEKECQLLVFPGGGTVHGVAFCSEPGIKDDLGISQSGFDHVPLDCIVYGEKKLAFCNLLSHTDRLDRYDVSIADEEKPGRYTTSLTLSDWIWTVKMVESSNDDGRIGVSVSLVVGFGRHFLEIWNVASEASSCETLLNVTFSRRLYMTPATMVTSMDCFFCHRNGILTIAAGTSFHNIWISSVVLDENTTENEGFAGSNCLKEHAGVVHSVKFSRVGTALVSCSDDRSVRWWVRDKAIQLFKQKWVGWGHNARVWSVSFASDDESLVVSASEDGTARIWSALSGESLACIQYGAASCSLWTVDTFGNTMVLGATDGTITMYDMHDRLKQQNLRVFEAIAIPDDRPKVITPMSQDDMSRPSSNDGKKKKKKKKKSKPQVIVGMKWWRDSTNQGHGSLLVATREGSLLSLDLDTEEWKDLNGWCDFSFSEKYRIHPSDGCCMAVQQSSRCMAFGTTRGLVVLVSFKEGLEKQYTVLNGESLRSVQALAWLSPACLVSFHVRSVAMWDTSHNLLDKHALCPSVVLCMETKGVPQSCAYDPMTHRMVVGDSRGSLSLFSTERNDNTDQRAPKSVLSRVHQKEHVNDIRWLDTNTVLSAGNDGCLCISYVLRDSLYKGWSFPAPSITGVTQLLFTQDNSLFNYSKSPVPVGGYYGNVFRMIDVRSGYENIQVDTGGRQRILDCIVEKPSNQLGMPCFFSLAVCMGQPDGSNNILVHQLQQPKTHPNESTNQVVARGVKLHGETIFGATFFTLHGGKTQFLATASEDCTTRISAWQNGIIVDSLMLTPQPSCVRCICYSQFDGSSALLAVGGGKLTLQFFLVRAQPDSTCRSVHDLRISYIGKGRTVTKSDTVALDQRINAVEAIPVDEENRQHLIIAGDSNGMVHLFVVSESATESYKSTMGIKRSLSEWPIISVKALDVLDRIVVLLGTTNGNIVILDLRKSCAEIRSAIENHDEVWNLLGIFRCHGMGTNAIDAHVIPKDIRHGCAELSVVTGGDDHSLSLIHVTVRPDVAGGPLSLLDDPKIQSVPGASYSAVKGVFHLFRDGRPCILSVGYSQTLCLWAAAEKGTDDQPKVMASAPVDLGDVNCMAVCTSSRVESEIWIAVCGMGVEFFKLS